MLAWRMNHIYRQICHSHTVRPKQFWLNADTIVKRFSINSIPCYVVECRLSVNITAVANVKIDDQSILAKTSLKFSQSGVKTTFKQDEGMQRGEKQFWQNFYFWQAEYYCWDTSEGRSGSWQNLVKQSRMMRALVDTGGRLCARNTDISPLPPFRFCISVLSLLHGP